MRASELISLLQEIIQECGDIPVCHTGFALQLEKCTVVARDGTKWTQGKEADYVQLD